MFAAGCAGPHPVVLDGNSKTATITYSGDFAAAQRVAARHCARYDRVPLLKARDLDTAYFACVKR